MTIVGPKQWQTPIVLFAEEGGLGSFHPDEVGPVDIQAPNGVIDILVKDEAEAVAHTGTGLNAQTGKKRHFIDTW